jgi:hypothetical protein
LFAQALALVCAEVLSREKLRRDHHIESINGTENSDKKKEKF